MDTNTNHLSIFVVPIYLCRSLPSQFTGASLQRHPQRQSSPENTQVKAGDVSSPTLNHNY
jgi:hypothetical protein